MNELNKKGFTLVEIVVSLAIVGIVLGGLGSILLGGFQNLFNIENADSDKQIVDNIKDLVREQLLYSNEVCIQKDKPDGDDWKALTIENYKLQLYNNNTNSKAYNEIKYNNKYFKITAKAYESSQRLDLRFILSDNKDDFDDNSANRYATKDTIELLNVESIKCNILDSELNIRNDNTSSNDNLKIYYRTTKTTTNTNNEQTKDEEIIDTPTNDDTGTVADTLNYDNNRWVYNFSGGSYYRKGDCVFYNNHWWMLNTDGGYGEPGVSASHWKCLSQYYTKNSKYSIGDIIIYNGKYYKRTSDPGWNPDPDDQYNRAWTQISEEEAKNSNLTDNRPVYQYDSKTIINKLSNIDVDQIPIYDESKNNSYSALGTTKPSKASDFVKIKDDEHSVDGVQVYRYYYRIYANDATPGNKSSDGHRGWQEIKLDYDSSSAYVSNDVILSVENGGKNICYFKALCNVYDDNSIEYIKTKKKSYNNGEYNVSELDSIYLNPASWLNASYKDFVWTKV